MTKDQRTIKAQAAQIAKLTEELASAERNYKYAEDNKNTYRKELDDMHSTFDLLCIPKRVKGTYNDLSANARLTLFLAQANGIKVAQPKEEE